MALVLIVTVNSGVVSADEYKLLWSYDIRTDCGSVVSLSPNGNYVAAGGCVVKYQSVWYGFYFFNKEGELLYESKSINDEPYDISISSNGGYIAILCHDGSDCDSDIYLFNKEGKVIWEYSIDDFYFDFSKVYVSQDGNYVRAEKGDGESLYLSKEGKKLDYVPNCKWVTVKEKSLDGNYKVRYDGDVLFFVKLSKIASDKISEAKSTISQTKSRGVIVTEAEELLSKAEQAFDAKDYNKAKEFAQKAEKKVQELPSLAASANDAVDDAKSAIPNEKSKGFYSAEVESLLSQAEQAFKMGKYEEAKSLAENATALALDIDQDGASNEEDFAPTIKNIYIYTGTPLALLVLATLTKVSLDVRKRRKIKRLEKQKIRREEEGRRLEYERRIRELKAKYEQYKREGYAPNKNLEEMLK